MPNIKWWTRGQSTTQIEEEESWCVLMDRLLLKLSPYLPQVSSTTRKAIVTIILLVLVWKLVIWSLEMIVTAVFMSAAVMLLVIIIRPDIGMWLMTDVLPPLIYSVRSSLSRIFLQASRSLSNEPAAIENTPNHISSDY